MKLKIIFLILISICAINPSFSQNSNKKIKITGSVVDANRQPVSGVSILVDGNQSNIVTNAQGVFSVRVLPTAKTITAFSLFNGVKEMPINGQPIVNIVLDGVSTKTSQPVVTESESVDIGYGTAKKDDVLNSVTAVDKKRLKNMTYTTIYDMIAREVPGSQVSGTSVKLQQGPGSFYSSTEPLYVLDGVVVSQIGSIVPAQVSSIEVLKGAAASIYGTRGSNGVLLINTIK